MLLIRCETDLTTLSSRKKIPTSFFVSFPMALLNVPKFHMKPGLIAGCFGTRLLRPPDARELIKAHCDYLSHFLTFLSNSADLSPTLALRTTDKGLFMFMAKITTVCSHIPGLL